MTGNSMYPSLCSTCKHASTCTFPKDPRRPSFYCEEFEIETAPPVLKAQEHTQQPPASQAAREVPGLIGLCSDCRNRRTCVFPHPEGGVWHCEEYQ